MIIARLLLLFIACLGQTLAAEYNQYFRSNLGIAEQSGPLPDNLDSPEVMRWRVAVDSGHSTPVIVGQRIFMTTFRPESNELATVALDVADGRLVWRQPAPISRIEPVHRIGS